MTSMRKFALVSALGFGLLAAGMASFNAGAARPAQHNPTVVVAVRLSAVLEGLNQFSDAQIRLKKIGDDFETEKNKQDTEYKSLKAQRDDLRDKIKSATDPNQKDKLIKNFDDLSETALDTYAKFSAWQRYAQEKADIEKSLVLQDLYQSIRASIQKMADERHYDLVVVDDSAGELAVNPESKASRESQIRQQIFDRQVLYISPPTDITDELIDYMNTAYKSGMSAATKNP
ncbi:MAG TPA: hypothetical protein VG711_05815 [Phycisphaerales bacterium]|nr:hypothetical protein [Phycisphaerales bacterium]